MNQLKVFTNPTFGSIRTLNIDGEPWFVASDVCKALDIDPTSTRRLDDDEKNTLRLTQGIPGNPNVTVVNEPGLYTLVLGSRKPEAKAFKRWVTSEVLPSIRKHGGYVAGQEHMSDEELMAKALLMAQKTIADRDARISALQVEVAVAQPKAAYFDELVDRNLLTGIRETAKELGIKQKVFVDFLLNKKYLHRSKSGKLTPTAGRGDGLFEMKECFNDKTSWAGTQVMVTPKGRETFRLLCQGM